MKPDGCRVWTAMGAEYRVFRPTFIQYAMTPTRHAQIIYPKAIGSFLLGAVVFAGAFVIEAGIGWGALAIKLIEAVGPSGRLLPSPIPAGFAGHRGGGGG